MTPLLHPGYHKTGTTWMQRRLFLPEHGFAPVLTHEDIDALILQPGPFSYDPARVHALANERHEAIGRHLVPVISSEIMSGQPYTGGRDCRMVADRLHATFPEARVILTIREQLGLLPSLYMQYLQAGGTLPCDRFFAGRTVIGNFGFDPVFHEYHHLVGHYADLFGRENVVVHPMELLIRRPEAMVEKLKSLTGVVTEASRVDFSNATYGAREAVVPVIRRINHVRKNDFDFGTMVDFGPVGWLAYRAVNRFSRSDLARRLGVTGKPVTEYVKAHFRGRYAASNAALQSYLSEDLGALGYPVMV